MLLEFALADAKMEGTVAEQSDEWLVARHYFSEASMRKIDEAVSTEGGCGLRRRLEMDTNKLASTGIFPPLAGTLPSLRGWRAST